jgi:hypothetical protein
MRLCLWIERCIPAKVAGPLLVALGYYVRKK